MFLKGNREKLRLSLRAELLFQTGSLPVKRKEGFLDFFLQFRVKIVDNAVTGCRKGSRFINGYQILAVDHPARFHAGQHGIGNGGGIVVLVGDTKDGIIVATGKSRFVITVDRQTELSLKQSLWCLEAGIGCFGRKCQGAAFELGQAGDPGSRIGDDFHLIAVGTISIGHDSKGTETGTGDGDGIRTGVETGNMKTTGTHRFKLGGIGLNREELYPLPCHLGHMVEELPPNFHVNRRIFDRSVSKDQGCRIDPLLWVGGDIGNQITIGIGKTGIHGRCCAGIEHQ